MPISKSETNINKAQRLADAKAEKDLEIHASIDIDHVRDILSGIAAGKTDAKYQITTQQYSALRDEFSLWKAFNPDKILANQGGKVKERHKKTNSENPSSNRPNIAVFSPTAG